MCKAMNRSFISVILGGFGETVSEEVKKNENKNVKSGGATDASFIMKNSESIIIVPGYGMAVAQAQHILKEMCDLLKKENIKVIICYSSCSRKNAWTYECFTSRSQRSL